MLSSAVGGVHVTEAAAASHDRPSTFPLYEDACPQAQRTQDTWGALLRQVRPLAGASAGAEYYVSVAGLSDDGRSFLAKARPVTSGSVTTYYYRFSRGRVVSKAQSSSTLTRWENRLYARPITIAKVSIPAGSGGVRVENCGF
jgi:hypothetical protein